MMSPVDPARRRPGPEGSRPHSLTWSASSPATAFAGVLLLVLAGCGGAETFPQTSLDPKSDLAVEIDNLWNLTLWLGIAVSIVTFAILGYIMYHFRYRPEAPEPKQFHGNTTLEIAWTLIPAVLISIIAVPTVQTIFFTYREAPADAVVIDVTGKQWWWDFRYPTENGDTVRTANEVHVPVGRAVELRITSSDVLHSFWIPQMGGQA